MPGDYQERRMADVESTHDFSKNAAQAMILINGGAVTAMMASRSAIVNYLICKSSENIAISLKCFAVCVLCGVLMHWFERQALYNFSQRWQWLEDCKIGGMNKDIAYVIDCHEIKGQKWHLLSTCSFVASCLSFLVGCFAIASLL